MRPRLSEDDRKLLRAVKAERDPPLYAYHAGWFHDWPATGKLFLRKLSQSAEIAPKVKKSAGGTPAKTLVTLELWRRWWNRITYEIPPWGWQNDPKLEGVTQRDFDYLRGLDEEPDAVPDWAGRIG